MATKLDYAALARRTHEREEVLAEQTDVVIARDLYAGWLSDDMLTRLGESFLATDSAELVTELSNLYARVVNSILDRLAVLELAGTTAATGEQQGNAAAAGFTPAPQWATDFWRANKLNQLQHEIYRRALRDGMCYVLLQPETDYLDNTVKVKVYIHERFTDVAAEGPTGNGTGTGIMAHYKNDTLVLGQKPIQHSLRWIETILEGDEETSWPRMTLYIQPTATERGRIEKYRMEDDEWVQFKDEGDPSWPIPWELPTPVIEFANTGYQMQGKKAIGLQMALDNALVALIMAAGVQAVPTGVLIGANPTDDGQPIADDASNMWRMGPGRFISMPDKMPDQVKLQWLPPGDLSQIINGIDQVVKQMAMTTATPDLLQNRLGSLPVAAALLKQLDIQIVAQVKRVQDSFGDSWSELFRVAAAMISEYMTGVQADPLQVVEVVWQPADLMGQFVDEGEEKPTSDLTPEAEATDAAAPMSNEVAA